MKVKAIEPYMVAVDAIFRSHYLIIELDVRSGVSQKQLALM